MSFSTAHLFFDDLEVGQEWTSGGRTVTEADIVHFAGFSGDFNPIHIDHEFARSTPFRQPIAHGLLVWAGAWWKITCTFSTLGAAPSTNRPRATAVLFIPPSRGSA